MKQRKFSNVLAILLCVGSAALALLVGTMPVSAQKTNSIETYVSPKATTYETLKRSGD